MYLFQFTLSDSNTFPCLVCGCGQGVMACCPSVLLSRPIFAATPPSLFFHFTLVEGLWPETLKLIFEQLHQMGNTCLGKGS